MIYPKIDMINNLYYIENKKSSNIIKLWIYLLILSLALFIIISFKYEFHQYKSYICEFKENTLIVNILEEDLNLFYDSSLYINDLNYKYNVIKEIKNGSYYEIYLNTDFNYNGYLNIVIKQPVTTIYKELKKGIKKWIS